MPILKASRGRIRIADAASLDLFEHRREISALHADADQRSTVVDATYGAGPLALKVTFLRLRESGEPAWPEEYADLIQE